VNSLVSTGKQGKDRKMEQILDGAVEQACAAQVWALDIIRSTMHDGMPFRALMVIDESDRWVLGIACGTSIPSARVARIMSKLMEVYGKPQAIRMDNGPELTADKFTDWAKEHGIELRFVQPGKPKQKAVIERLNHRFHEALLDAWHFNAISEVQTAADRWVVDYNEYRTHVSRGDVPSVRSKPRAFNAENSTSGLAT
jgi:putative transposase